MSKKIAVAFAFQFSIAITHVGEDVLHTVRECEQALVKAQLGVIDAIKDDCALLDVIGEVCSEAIGLDPNT